MHLKQSFVAHTKSSELMQPGDSALDHPACQAEMTSVFGTSLANLLLDTTISQHASMCLAVVAAISLHASRLAQWAARASRNRFDAVEQRHELGGVVTVCSRQDDGEQRAVGVDEQVVLTARFAP